MDNPSRNAASSLTNVLARQGSLAAIGAYLLYSMSAPITKWLITHGNDLGAHGGAAVSFCNLLTIGNLAAATLMLTLSGFRHVFGGLGKLTRLGIASLVASSLISVAAPALFFFSLKYTTVPNVILISRAGPIFFALVGTFVLGKRVTSNQWIGYGFIVVAIAIAIPFGSSNSPSVGDILALGAAFCAAMASIVGRPALDQAGLKPFVFSRNLIAAGCFAAIAISMFGPRHFADLLNPAVVAGVSVYGIVVVGFAQLFWFFAIVHASPGTVGGWSFVSPLSAIVLTTVFLMERPHEAQWLALGMVVMGMLIAARGQRVRPNPPTDATLAAA